MKKFWIILLIYISLFPIKIFAFTTSATSGILMDMDSGRILYSKDIHAKRSVASISKIMTAVLAIESEKLYETVTIGDEINAAYGSGVYIKVGEQMKLIDLVYGLMLRSGNDAALAIANYVGGNVVDFVKMMNDKAISLGMKNSEFNNPSGLDEEKGNFSTAYDMALLTSYAMQNDIYSKIVSTKRYKVKTNVNYYDWTNKNKLLFSYKYTTGGKTGFTEIAKRTLVTTASKDNLNLVVVTLNDGNDFNDHKNLYEEAFANYQNYQILSKGNIYIPGESYYKSSELYLEKDFTYPFIEEEKSGVLVKYKLNKLREYNSGDAVGEAEVFINEELINSSPIYVRKNEEVSNKNFFDKIIDWFKNLW